MNTARAIALLSRARPGPTDAEADACTTVPAAMKRHIFVRRDAAVEALDMAAAAAAGGTDDGGAARPLTAEEARDVRGRLASDMALVRLADGSGCAALQAAGLLVAAHVGLRADRLGRTWDHVVDKGLTFALPFLALVAGDASRPGDGPPPDHWELLFDLPLRDVVTCSTFLTLVLTDDARAAVGPLLQPVKQGRLDVTYAALEELAHGEWTE